MSLHTCGRCGELASIPSGNVARYVFHEARADGAYCGGFVDTLPKAEAIRERLAREDLTYLAWCAQRGLDPYANQGEGHWQEFWADGGASEA